MLLLLLLVNLSFLYISNKSNKIIIRCVLRVETQKKKKEKQNLFPCEKVFLFGFSFSGRNMAGKNTRYIQVDFSLRGTW